MKTQHSDYPSERVWRIAEIPKNSPESLDWIDIKVSYNGDSSALQAEALDRYVTPLFKLAPRLLELALQLPVSQLQSALTAEEWRSLSYLAGLPEYGVGTPDVEGGYAMYWGPDPSLSAALHVRPCKDDVLFKFVRGVEQVIARSDGSKWVVEPPSPDETDYLQ